MARTAKQIQAEQQQQADADRKGASALPATRNAALPDAPDHRNARQRLLDDVAPSGIVGRLARFDGKGGRFLFVDTDETISADEDFVVLADQAVVAYVKFQEEGPPLRVGGLLYAPDFTLPPREMLGDTNPTKWAVGFSGAPEDPWKVEMLLVLKCPATQELLTFSTMSKTGRRAVGSLLRHYDRLQVSNPGAFPVVRLKPSGYDDDRYGRVHTPSFAVVGVSPGHTAAIPDTSAKGQLNDEIPF
jgi:hypothetical protein